jgi:hypothetical protein
MRRTGVTRCLPTLITSSFDRFAASARVLSHSSHPAIAGIHMEGPYVSPDDGYRGAHPQADVATPTLDDFRRRQDAAAGRIVLVTLAPERPGALRLIEHLVAAGIRVALGHTAATAPQIADAITAGATLATHLGNGCPQLLPRHPNVIWDLLAADALAASVIADGHHLPPATVKSLIRAKGARRTILVTGCDRRRRVSHRDATASPASSAISTTTDACRCRGTPYPRRLQPDDGPSHRQRRAIHRDFRSTTWCRWRRRYRRRIWARRQQARSPPIGTPPHASSDLRRQPMTITLLDWAVLVGYLIAITAIGLIVGYRVRRSREYFLGDRSSARG